MKTQGRFFVYAMPERTHDATVLVAFKTKADRSAVKKLLPGFRDEAKNVLQLDFFKAEIAKVATLLDPFIVGDVKSTDLIPSQPLVFQGNIFDLDFTKALVESRILPGQEGMTNVERFRSAYLVALAHEVETNPDDYLYTVDKVPTVVEKMIPAFAKGEASIGPACKKAARACGIKTTIGAIKTFLTS